MSKHTLQDLLHPNARHSGTPEDLVLRDEARRPEMDATLGIEVKAKANAEGRKSKHRLVTLGDSLTQGFQSGAAHKTSLSWPLIVAWELGVDEDLVVPTYRRFGGIPFNLESLARILQEKLGESLDSTWESIRGGIIGLEFYEQVAGYWGDAWQEDLPSRPVHNLAAFGWDLCDLLRTTSLTCREEIQKRPSYRKTAKERSAYRVLASARDDKGDALTPLGAARELAKDDGIETLVVMIGSNNALGAVVGLDVAWSQTGNDAIPAFKNPEQRRAFTVWHPLHFAAEFDSLVKELETIDAEHVILATVPHVTVPPITRGLTRGGGKVASGSRYFEFYVRPWVSAEEFDWRDDKCLTASQARAIDSAIDAYNDHIVEVVRKKRQAGHDWYLLEVAGMLDRLAARRYIEDPEARPSWWDAVGGEYPQPAELKKFGFNSHFFRADRSGRTDGGLFSLDGVHPTTIGYGMIAQEVINVMHRAGVRFQFGNGVERPGPVAVDFKRLLKLDSLVSAPPALSADMVDLLGRLDSTLDGILDRIGLHVPLP